MAPPPLGCINFVHMTESAQLTSPPKYDYIDALRGIAIMLVVMVHTSQYGSGTKFFASALTGVVQNGARGVQLFFVASALTLWLSMANRNRKHETHPTRNFFIRRLFRIAPMYWLGIAFYSTWFFAQQAPLVTPANVAANFFFVHGISPYWINSLVPGGWSITVEMFFYVLAPWLFWRIRTLDHAVRFILITLLLDTVITLVLTNRPLIANKALWTDFLFLYFPSQLPVFGLGILLFFILRHPEQRVGASTLLLTAALLFFNLAAGLPLVPPHMWAGASFVALALALNRKPVRLLVNGFTRYVGKISFSLYLVHFAVLFALEQSAVTDLLHPTRMVTAIINYGLRFGIVLAISSLLATAFYRLVEVPGQTLGRKLIASLEPKAA